MCGGRRCVEMGEVQGEGRYVNVVEVGRRCVRGEEGRWRM